MKARAIRGRKRLIVVATIMVLAAGLFWGVVSALGASASPSPEAGKTILRLGWTNDPDNLNPFIGYESSSYEIWAINYDLMVGFRSSDMSTPSGKDATGLATDWTHTADGKEWTFTLRSGVKWQDGQPFTANDVAWTFNFIIKNQMGAFASYTNFIDKVVAVDDTHVKFMCSQPKANMLGLWIPILPEHIWSKLTPQQAGASFQNNPPIIGTGPFQTVQRQKGKFVRLVKNPNYWGGAPKVDEVIFETYQNNDVMAEDLKTGNIQAGWNIPEVQVGPLNNPPTTAIKCVTLGFDELAINAYTGPKSLGNPVLKDPAFRRALNYAIDRNKIAELAYHGFAAPADTIITKPYYEGAPIQWHWDPTDPYTFDLKKAAAALDAAGYPLKNGVRVDKKGKPIKLRLWARSESATSNNSGKFIAGWFGQLGLNIQFSSMDDGAISDHIYNTSGKDYAPDYDMFLWGWGGDVDPNFILSIFLTSQIGSWSDCGYSNPTYDKLFEQQQGTLDPQKRKQIIDQMQQILYNDSPYIVLVYPMDLEAYNSKDWTGWVRAPKNKGGVFYVTQNDTYLQVHPGSAASSSGSGTTVILIIVGVALVVVVVVVVLLMRRRRGRVVEDTE